MDRLAVDSLEALLHLRPADFKALGQLGLRVIGTQVAHEKIVDAVDLLDLTAVKIGLARAARDRLQPFQVDQQLQRLELEVFGAQLPGQHIELREQIIDRRVGRNGVGPPVAAEAVGQRPQIDIKGRHFAPDGGLGHTQLKGDGDAVIMAERKADGAAVVNTGNDAHLSPVETAAGIAGGHFKAPLPAVVNDQHIHPALKLRKAVLHVEVVEHDVDTVEGAVYGHQALPALVGGLHDLAHVVGDHHIDAAACHAVVELVPDRADSGGRGSWRRGRRESGRP